jgi:hypothetical protein
LLKNEVSGKLIARHKIYRYFYHLSVNKI